MSKFLMILMGIVSIVVILSIMLQSGNSAGLSGSIAGGAEQLLGKKKSKGYDEILSKITIASSVVFFILAIVLTAME